MKHRMKDICVLAENGEILYQGIYTDIKKKYKPDILFDRALFSYIIILFCATVDAAAFYSLFEMLSYDRPIVMITEIMGFLFAFDFIPIYLGIHLRRLKEGLDHDRFILWLPAVVCIIACILNCTLRVMTIDEVIPKESDTSTSYYSTLEEEDEEEGDAMDSKALPLTLFGICLPMITSIGSLYISYSTYHPLMIRKRREEVMLEEKREEIRRLEAILDEYNADQDFAMRLKADDEGNYEEMKKMQRAITIGYCDYVRQRLKEHIGEPASTSALSQESCDEILERLEAKLDRVETKETI